MKQFHAFENIYDGCARAFADAQKRSLYSPEKPWRQTAVRGLHRYLWVIYDDYYAKTR